MRVHEIHHFSRIYFENHILLYLLSIAQDYNIEPEKIKKKRRQMLISESVLINNTTILDEIILEAFRNERFIRQQLFKYRTLS